MSFWWAHLVTSLFVVLYISKVSRYYLFWFLFLVVLLFSSELRLSLEYFLISSALVGYSLSESWQNVSQNLRRLILAISFFAFFIIDYLNFGWVEKGSALMLLPIFLALYFPLKKLDFKIQRQSLSQFGVYSFSFIAMLFSNKRTSIIAFLATLKNLFSKKILIVFSLLVLASSFLIKDNITNFYRKSIAPRTLIWQGALNGFKDKVIFGHGFGTYTIDFPPYRLQQKGTVGAEETEYIVHGHSQILHSLFEWGLLGLALFLFLSILIFKYANNAFLPFLIISLFNVSLQSFPQIFLLALLMNPLEHNQEKLFKQIDSGRLQKILKTFLVLITILMMSMSTLAHYFFDRNQLSSAIRIDPLHPLYYFSRGANNINKDIEKSRDDFAKAVDLAPGVGYMHGFYAASLLGSGDSKNAKLHIALSLEQMGEDPYLLILSSFINRDDKTLAQEQYQKALELNPDLEELLNDPSYSADEFIGVRSSNPRIMSFYRRGKKIYLPLPYVELE